MSYIESLSFLFFDSFFAAFVFSMSNEMVVDLMKIIPGYAIHEVFMLALLGSIFGSCVNWWIGKSFQFLYKTNAFTLNVEEISRAQAKWNKHVVYILLLSWIAVIGGPFAVIAGFLKTSLKKFLLIIFTSKCIYYCLWVFYDFDLLGW